MQPTFFAFEPLPIKPLCLPCSRPTTELLRLQELERSLTRVESSQQFTTREKRSLLLSVELVKNSIPETVLERYDQLKKSEGTLMRSPEIFADGCPGDDL